MQIPAEPSPELPIPGAAAQTRMVSVGKIRLDRRKSTRLFKGIICDDISEFESHMPSHAVWSLWARSALRQSPGRVTRRDGLYLAMIYLRMLCFLSSRTVLACGPFSPISSTKVTCVPTARRLNAPFSTLLR